MAATYAHLRDLDQLDIVTSTINTSIEVIPYMLSILPDAILPGAGFHALFTLSSTYGMFFASLIEARLILWGIHSFAHQYAPQILFATESQILGENALCKNKITHTIQGKEFMDGPAGHLYTFPSSPMYMLGVASSYVFNTLNAQSKELEALGPAFSTRYYVSLTFLLFLIGLIASFRMVYNCETFNSVMLSSIIGLLIGYLLVMQNKLLVGDSSVNMLGIPQLRNRTASGKKIYVCPK